MNFFYLNTYILYKINKLDYAIKKNLNSNNLMFNDISNSRFMNYLYITFYHFIDTGSHIVTESFFLHVLLNGKKKNYHHHCHQ